MPVLALLITYGSTTFNPQHSMCTGLAITLAAAVMLLVLALTCGSWTGYLTHAL